MTIYLHGKLVFATRRGGQPPCRGAIGYGKGQHAREANSAHKGWQPSVGAVTRRDGGCRQKRHPRHSRLHRSTRKGGQLHDAHKGLPPAASPTASRYDGVGRRGGRPLAGQLQVGKEVATCVGAVAVMVAAQRGQEG
ncbi:hypothetical protein B296_00034456 [Ensete ventricosum]|uniref:Uncharacterized protein n=1 Tax=Ensete ventricosum TaxID=4639 RepID=A0A426WYZ9_ENSVE|nr:hypothetical protein B296_00034456 [Ensete ventricosum]